MNKEKQKQLSPLEAVFLLKSKLTNAECIRFGGYITIIETALKRNVELEKEVKNLRVAFYEKCDDITNLCNTYEKKLKALEIIKKYTNNNGIDVDFGGFQDIYGHYNEKTMKEYNLLKEVLL